MKNHIFRTIFISLILVGFTATETKAQMLTSSYFLEGMPYRHEMNPSFINERGYMNFPFIAIGNLNLGLQSNVGIKNFLYPYNQNGYELTTFMNPMVSSEEFLGGLKDNNEFNINLRMPILTFGFHGFGGFNTFGINLRSSSSITLPYGLFSFMKNSMDDSNGTHHSFENLGIRTNNYVELALGHAHEVIEDRLSVGAKVKFLIGAANANLRIDKMDMYLSDKKWEIKAKGYGNFSILNDALYLGDQNVGEEIDYDNIDFNTDNGYVGGYGIAFDLGATYKLDDFVEGLTVSASLLDLGFIKWKNGRRIKMANEYTFDGFDNLAIHSNDANGNNTIEDQVEEIGDELEEFARFYDDGLITDRKTKLASTLNIGVEYALPYYNKLRFGFLSSTYFNKPFTWTEGRFSANISPVRCFEAAITYGISSFGSSFGWVLNYHNAGFSLFVGSDHLFTKVNPQGIPMGKMNADVSLGLNITFGKKK